MIYKRLQIKLNAFGCPYATDWLQYQTTVVHCSLNSLDNLSVILSFNIYIYIRIYIYIYIYIYWYNKFQWNAGHEMLSAPSGCAPQLAGRWSSSAAERSAGVRAPSPRRKRRARSAALAKSCGASEAARRFWNFRGNVDLFQTVPNCQTNFSEWLLILQNVCRLANFSLLTANALQHQDTKLSRYCGSTTTKGGSGTVGSWRFAWKVAMSLQCPCPTTKSCRNLA